MEDENGCARHLSLRRNDGRRPGEPRLRGVASDGNDLPFVTTGLYIGSGGDLAVLDRASGETVVFKNLSDGAGLPIRVARVLATGTTATQIVGMA